MPRPRGLVQQLDQSWHRHGAGAGLPRDARLLVAVSGGADSVALLRLLADVNRSDYWRWILVVGHVDHGLRGAASRADSRFVAALARRLGLPCAIRRLTLPAGSSEDAARQKRLQALSDMCRARKCVGVIMAHHADDQAETVLMRIFRGTGIDGLAAMTSRTQVAGMTVFRPLLQVRRAALRDFLRHMHQSWRDDETNATDQFLRNRLRLQVMPLIESLWPRAVEALGRLALLAGEAQDLVRDAAQRCMNETPAWRHNRVIQFPREALRQIPPAVASEVLRQLIAALGGTPESADFERLREAVRILAGPHGGKTVQLGAGITLSTHRGLVRVAHVRTLRRRRA
jgi:tRNA(Ile)-lysidine synthase